MDTWRRLARLSLVPMIFIVPLWITVGRGLFGVGGWEMLALLFFYAPILLVGMIVLGVVLSGRPDVKTSGKVSKLDAILLGIFYGSIFVFGLALVGGGDTLESVKSVFTVLFGRQLLDVSAALSVISAWGFQLSGVACLVVAIRERWQARHLQ